MKILVTGTAGFIGSSFVRQLLGFSFHPDASRVYSIHNGLRGLSSKNSENFKIVSVDLITYAGCVDNLEPVLKHPSHIFVKGDICDVKLVESIVKEHEISAIINFAAESHVDRSILGSGPFLKTNVEGTVSLLDVAKKYGLKFLQVSTDEVYGALGPAGSFTEETPLAPNSPYSASKTAADCFVRSYVETHGLNAIITRCSNNYGPYQFPEKFLPLAITKLMKGMKIPVYGKGQNIRDWLHVEDHCEGIWLAFTKGKKGQVYNIGGFGEKSNIEMARGLALSFGLSESQAIEYVQDRKGHDFRYSMDSKKISSELGWKAHWELQAGLSHMRSWYEQNQNWWISKLSENITKLK